MIELRKTEEIAESLDSVLKHISSKCETLVPNARIEHIGSSSIPGALSKGDVDILVMVKADSFGGAKAALDSEFAHNPGMPPEENFVSYSGTHLGTDFGIQLAADLDDKFHFLELRDRLIASTELLEKYNRVKTEHADKSMTEYRKAKSDFIHEIVGDT